MKKGLILLFILSLNSFLYSQNIYRKKFKLMGCDFSISVVSKDSTKANKLILLAKNEMQRIENLISSWDSTSQTSLINKNAGIKPVKVSLELYNLIEIKRS